MKPVLDIHERPKLAKWIILSMQHLFAMFGATILVPVLTGLSPSVALVSSGLGTIAYLITTRGKIPAYVGSSFAFISPLISAMTFGGPGAVMLGTFSAGIVYGLTSLLIMAFGVNWLLKLLPPIVVGPVIMVIGLGLASTAIEMAMNYDASTGEYVDTALHFTIALITLTVTIVSSVFFKGFLRLIPVLIGLVTGYVISIFAGLVDLTPVQQAPWFHIPDFAIPYITVDPIYSLAIIGIMAPIALVTMAEHIGDQMVLSKITGRNFLKDPGLHRSLLGDGIASVIASFVGGPPNTTYGENIGVLAITKVFSVFVIGGAAVFAIVFGFSGKIEALIASIPVSVMGGVSILLFGIIASSGLRLIVENRLDMSENRNLVIASTILVIGIGGAFIEITEDLVIPSMALATFIGMILHGVLPNKTIGYGNGQLFESVEDDQNNG
ncbi:uracil-xanthine permease family protein [Geomicrobium sp. JCM 19038]|uniref:uracil-xanthine permease family protein n=1 Tax=Geomicrobium sp. JCM 19038 TaxID=1460635 RepID=UPI00045F15C2|nr:solute carrier family 23 protein [Geomicrobium sp. JCM 19038]GAK07447.1 uracil permease [Geomicrobium sp. JCM 19038]